MTPSEFVARYHAYRTPFLREARRTRDLVMAEGVDGDAAVVVQYDPFEYGLALASSRGLFDKLFAHGPHVVGPEVPDDDGPTT